MINTSSYYHHVFILSDIHNNSQSISRTAKKSIRWSIFPINKPASFSHVIYGVGIINKCREKRKDASIQCTQCIQFWKNNHHDIRVPSAKDTEMLGPKTLHIHNDITYQYEMIVIWRWMVGRVFQIWLDWLRLSWVCL